MFKPIVVQTAESGKGKKVLIFIYLFFIAHMGVFGTATFFLTYGEQNIEFATMFGGFAVFVYAIFYLVIFGFDELKWLFINSLLGVLGIYGWLEELAHYFLPNAVGGEAFVNTIYTKYTSFSQFPIAWHLLPGTFFIMYEFLLRNFLIDLFGARKKTERKRSVGILFILISIIQFLISRFF